MLVVVEVLGLVAEVQEGLVVEALVELLALVKTEELDQPTLVVVGVMDQQMCRVVMEVLVKLF